MTADRPICDENMRAGRVKRYDHDVPPRDLDPVDRTILELLVADARRSASEIGRLVNLSPAAAKRRIDRLEQLGYIRGYTAILDHAMLGGQLEAFSELRFAAGTQVDDIDSAFANLPELVESFTVAGDPDALVRLRVSDVDHLKRVIDRIRRAQRGTAKIIGTKTLIVLGSRTGPAGTRS
jgi:Lrp/AsnC family transcriptional regulator, leucine-responsive regulatory protein